MADYIHNKYIRGNQGITDTNIIKKNYQKKWLQNTERMSGRNLVMYLFVKRLIALH
jgi:hypothetical protein